MELAIAVLWLFILGMLAYAAAQLGTAARDVWHALPLRAARRLADAGSAAAGTVVLRARVRPVATVAAPSGGERVVAWSTHPSYGLGGDREHAEFELVDDGVVARVRARRLCLLAEEETDVLGNRLRLLRPDQEVVVHGRLGAGADGAPVVEEVPGRCLVVALPRRPPFVRAAARGLLALALVAGCAASVVIAHIGQ